MVQAAEGVLIKRADPYTGLGRIYLYESTLQDARFRIHPYKNPGRQYELTQKDQGKINHQQNEKVTYY